MAQHFQVRYTDDIDGTDLGESANTISFAFEGKEYSIDLSDDNAQALREAVAPYIEAGHRVTGAKTKAARKTTGKTSPADTKAIREWARENGHDVSNRGRIPADVSSTERSAAAPTSSGSSPTGTPSFASSAPSWPSRPTNGPKAAATSAWKSWAAAASP